MLHRALASVFCLLSSVFFLLGCDTPDLRNVVFKPPTEDPEAYKNALRAYFITTVERAQPWGNELLTRQELALGPGKEPLPNLLVRLDGLEERADRKGFLALERLVPGFHAVEVPAGQGVHRFALPIEKGRMTLCIFELLPGGRSLATYTVLPHGFLLTQPLRELAQRHRAVGRVLDALEGRPDDMAFADAIAGDYADHWGGRGDLLKARGMLAAADRLPVLRIERATALVVPGQGDVLIRYSLGGRPGVARLELTSELELSAPWQLARVRGLNPFGPAAAPSEGPVLAGAPPVQEPESGLGRGIRGVSRGSYFKPDETGVVDRDPFANPVDRAHPDLSNPPARMERRPIPATAHQSPYPANLQQMPARTR